MVLHPPLPWSVSAFRNLILNEEKFMQKKIARSPSWSESSRRARNLLNNLFVFDSEIREGEDDMSLVSHECCSQYLLQSELCGIKIHCKTKHCHSLHCLDCLTQLSYAAVYSFYISISDVDVSKAASILASPIIYLKPV